MAKKSTKKSTAKVETEPVIMKGYKAFDKDLKCRDLQYKIGEPTRCEGDLILCQNGLHFCIKPNDCFEYYEFNSKDTRVCEIEAIEVSKQTENDSKRVCRQITPIRELDWNEVLNLINSGSNNSGRSNSGHRNSGHSNSGHSNSGDFNSGHFNSGDFNSGHSNSGDFNSGRRNSGSWNKCDHETGFFNSFNAIIRVFNQPCDRQKWEECDKPNFIFNINLTKWIFFSQMTDQEKVNHPNAEIRDGYLKQYTYQEAWTNAFKTATPRDIMLLKALPNFDPVVFKEITGIDII